MATIREEIKEALGDFGIAAFAAFLVHWILKRGGEVILEQAQKKHAELGDKRADLAKDLLNMEPGERDMLIGRLEEAKKTPGEENRMASLLCRLPKDDKGSRVELLKKLNALKDKEFDTVLYAIENDMVTQLLLRTLREGGAVAKVAMSNIVAFSKEVDAKAATGINALAEMARDFTRRIR